MEGAIQNSKGDIKLFVFVFLNDQIYKRQIYTEYIQIYTNIQNTKYKRQKTFVLQTFLILPIAGNAPFVKEFVITFLVKKIISGKKFELTKISEMGVEQMC